MMNKLLIIMLALVLVNHSGCGHAKPKPPTRPPGSVSCDVVCGNVTKLGCSFADSCPELCGAQDDEFLDCVAGASSCEEITNTCDKTRAQ